MYLFYVGSGGQTGQTTYYLEHPSDNSDVAIYHNGVYWQKKSIQGQDPYTYCENLTLDSYSDWKLPTEGELRALSNNSGTIDVSGELYHFSSSQVQQANYSCLIVINSSSQGLAGGVLNCGNGVTTGGWHTKCLR